MSDTSGFLDQPPGGDRLTEYDRAHLKLYLRLLDAETDGASWEEIVKVLFGIDARSDTGRAERLYLTHLARARWLAENGFKDLIRSSYH